MSRYLIGPVGHGRWARRHSGLLHCRNLNPLIFWRQLQCLFYENAFECLIHVTARCEDVTHVWQLAVMPPVCQPQPRSSLRVSSNDTFCWCLAFFNLSREGGDCDTELSSPREALLTQACCRNVRIQNTAWRCEVCALSGIFLVIVDTEDTIGLCGELLGLGRQLTILPFNASYYSRDSDSDGTQVRTQRRWKTFYPSSCYYVFWTAFTTHI